MTAIFKILYDVITPPSIVRLLRNLARGCHLLMTAHMSKSKPETELKYGGRLFSEIGSSYISAVDRDISSKFGMRTDFHLLKQIPSLNLNLEVDFRSYGAILKIRYDVITPPSIVRLLRNLAGGCKMACR